MSKASCFEAISTRNRFSNAYFGLKSPKIVIVQICFSAFLCFRICNMSKPAYIRVFVVVSVLLLLFTARNTAEYSHIHFLADGSIVHHVHPFSGNDTKGHHHTKSDFDFLAYANTPMFLFSFVSSLLSPATLEAPEAETAYRKIYLPAVAGKCIQGRAPPAIFTF